MTQKNSMFDMAGTESTWQYMVLLVTTLGRIGVRVLEGKSRIRVEPASAEAAALLKQHFPNSRWKQPGDDGQDRFSIVVPDSQVEGTVLSTLAALLSGVTAFGTDEQSPDWLRDFVEGGSAIAVNPDLLDADAAIVRGYLVAQVKELKVPGCNFAKNWGTEALIRNLVTAVEVYQA